MKATTSLLRHLAPVAAAFVFATGCGDSDVPTPSTDSPSAAPTEDSGPEHVLALDLTALEPEAVEILSEIRETVRAAPENPETWARFGMALYANGLEPQAIECFRFASSQKPNQPRWRYLEALALWSTGDRTAALAGLGETFALRDDYGPAHCTHGYWLHELDRLDEAQAAFERALEVKANEPAALIGIALIHMQRGEGAEALSLIRRVQQSRPEDAYVRGLLAKALRKAGRAGEAQNLAAQGTSTTPSWWDPWLDEAYQYRAVTYASKCQAAKILLRAGKMEQALEMQRQLLVDHPDDTELLFDTAMTCDRLRRFTEAARLTRECLARDADHVNALCMLGKLLARAGEPEEGLGHLDRALELAPEDPGVHFYRGSVLRRMEDLEGAVAAYRKSLEINPESATTWVAVGNVELEREAWEKALEAFETAEANGIKTGDVYLGKAEALLGLDRRAECWEALGEVVKDPQGDRTRFNDVQSELRRRQREDGEKARAEEAEGGSEGDDG